MEDQKASQTMPASALHGRATEGGVKLECAVGNDPAHVWCRPCVGMGRCARLRPMPGPDVFTFQPLTGKPLSPNQQRALDHLREVDGYSVLAEICNQYSTALALWRRGLAKCGEMAPHLSPMTQLWIARPTAQSGDQEEPHAGDSGPNKETNQ